MNSTVSTLAIDRSGNLYAGGSFTLAGSNAANRIAKWNDSAWSALGSGMNGPVYSLTVDKNGIVYAGGAFATAGGLSVNNVARWNGNTWEVLGAGITGGSVDGPQVSALGVDDFGNLY